MYGTTAADKYKSDGGTGEASTQRYHFLARDFEAGRRIPEKRGLRIDQGLIMKTPYHKPHIVKGQPVDSGTGFWIRTKTPGPN